jgi:hypothetical protein
MFGLARIFRFLYITYSKIQDPKKIIAYEAPYAPDIVSPEKKNDKTESKSACPQATQPNPRKDSPKLNNVQTLFDFLLKISIPTVACSFLFTK